MDVAYSCIHFFCVDVCFSICTQNNNNQVICICYTILLYTELHITHAFFVCNHNQRILFQNALFLSFSMSPIYVASYFISKLHSYYTRQHCIGIGYRICNISFLFSFLFRFLLVLLFFISFSIIIIFHSFSFRFRSIQTVI